jgi:hypothetical protein
MKNPAKAPIAAVDKLVEKDKLDQIILKVQGLTDLWQTLHDAPTIEQNAELVRRVFQTEIDFEKWNRIANVARELESVMRMNEERPLPLSE